MLRAWAAGGTAAALSTAGIFAAGKTSAASTAGSGTGRLPYPSGVTDTSHCTPEVAEIFRGFFTAKSEHDVPAVMSYFTQANTTYIDACLGIALTSWEEVNNEFTKILRQTGTLVFATVLYCVINIRDRDVLLARAGHPAPLHVRHTAKEASVLPFCDGSSGPAMGLIPDAKFKSSEVTLSPGDFLLFYTDGIIEVENKKGEEFGIEGLRQSIQSNLHQPGEVLLDAIISDAYNFAGSKVLTDDACLVVAEV